MSDHKVARDAAAAHHWKLLTCPFQMRADPDFALDSESKKQAAHQSDGFLSLGHVCIVSIIARLFQSLHAWNSKGQMYTFRFLQVSHAP
jgi:hypothetical protein